MPDAKEEEPRSALRQIGHLADVQVYVDVELDRKILSMRSLLELEAGSVIRMTRSAGENIDILIGGSLIAFGEIVIIEDTMGIRITDFNVEE